ncbi:hypothetical protein BpHYR1_020679 [Brachionus plicatilis]|uniref:Uncharacterized protein n=1 Tax=Brachionus plicatilis TaxID=10195 RepID=A0A3M7T7E6_BRAPC|nr:hypothetical protein BpHYR1_020679 [Brachionus plicatilis]
MNNYFFSIFVYSESDHLKFHCGEKTDIDVRDYSSKTSIEIINRLFMDINRGLVDSNYSQNLDPEEGHYWSKRVDLYESLLHLILRIEAGRVPLNYQNSPSVVGGIPSKKQKKTS